MSGFVDKLKRVFGDKERLRSIVPFLTFVFIALLMWLFVTFNRTITTDMEIHLLVDKPTNVHFLSKVPDSLTVNVSAHGTSFFKYMFTWPELRLRFDDYSDGNGNFKVESSQLKKALSKVFGKITVVSVLPGEITARYTDLPGKSVPVILDIEIETAPGYARTGDVLCSQDSVFVYGDSKTMQNINEVYSYHVKEVGLKDTLRRTITIAAVNGAVMEPRTIEITVPVEKLVVKTQEIPIAVRNAPDSVNVLLFPSKVTATFYVPLSQYKKETQVVTAVVDYNSINTTTTDNKVEVRVGETPGFFTDVKLSLDSVEYIVEKF